MEFFHHETNSIPSVAAFISGFILVFGLVSFVIKEKVFLSDSLVATLVGIVFGPICFNFINPFLWQTDLNVSFACDLSEFNGRELLHHANDPSRICGHFREIMVTLTFPQLTTFHFTDLVLNIQIMAAAIALPRRFWLSRWKCLAILLGPITLYMWLSTSIIFRYLLGLGWYESLLLASCCAPTDPILANSIVNGRFAELHINTRVRRLLSGESAANDGAVLPFFQLALFLLQYNSVGEAFGKWAYFTLAYSLIGSLILGIIIGYTARCSLRFSETHQWIDKKNFLVFELALAMFTSGIASMLNMASFIAVLVAGITFSWDGWFADETEDAHVQEVIDMLVNMVFFIYFGSIIPWSSYTGGDGPLSWWKLLTATIVILFVRRLPAVLMFMRFLKPLLSTQEAVVVGWFGPIGVGAIWYQTHALEYLPGLAPTFTPIISFIVFASIICHGITLPFLHLTIVGHRTWSTRSMSQSSVAGALRWPTGVDVGSLVISGPADMVMTGDGRFVPVSSINLCNPASPPIVINSLEGVIAVQEKGVVAIEDETTAASNTTIGISFDEGGGDNLHVE